MKSRAFASCVGSLLVVSLAAADASAQPRPGTAQPGQIERQFERPPEPTVQGGTITIPAASQQAPANAEGIRFVLNQLTVDGVTVYPAETLRKIYAASLGKEVALAEIYRIVDVLTAKYRNDGYILSQVVVPAQAVEAGAVRLQALEGYIADVRVEGGSEAVRRRATAYANRIKGQKPLTAGTLERNVLLLNDLPGIQARAVLAPGSQPGAAQLVLQLSQHHAAAGVSSDSRGSRAQGRQRLFGDIDLNNLTGASTTELREVTTGTPELSYTAVAHDQYIGSHGSKIGVSGSYVYSKPQELAFIPLELTTKSATATLTFTQTLLRSRARNLYFRASLGGFDSRSTVFGIKDTTDRLRSARVGLTFDAGDRIGGVTIADIEYSQGLKGLGASANGDEYLSRPTGRADFQKAAVYAARIQSLPKNWSIVFAATGQYAFTDLLAPELFSVGGEQFGRGYDPSELLNDHGAALKLDLRYSHTWGARRPTTLMPYVFADAGRVWQRTTFPGLESEQTASSAGAGLRLNIGAQLSGFVEVAKPLDRIVGQENSRDPRVFAGISIQ
ncbi:MAG TPA: ShlB/FhaC/HecB family hemolysin secretion/activation protein [Vicinamibacterales bacterium]|nr:ShlB/FhaC/HecB family hemolysin secretion/activation protein [Vicinamibacterales bacterium]